MQSSGVDASALTYAKRSDYIIYVLVVNKYATLKEIRDDYTIEEVLDLYEMCMVNMYNKQMLLKKGGN